MKSRNGYEIIKMKEKTFLVILVEIMLSSILPGFENEWKYEKSAQYLCLGLLVLFFVVVLGGIIMFNLH